MRYERVTCEADLIAALTQPGVAVLAGGTDLLVKIRAGIASPDLLVDVGRVPTLLDIRVTPQAIEIGAAVPLCEVLAAPAVRDRWPLLETVLRSLGAVQIRNRATLGGNLVNASPAADSAVALLLYDAQVDLVGPAGTRSLPVEQFLLGPGRTALGAQEFLRTIRIPIPEVQDRPFYHKVGKRRALTIAIASVGGLLRVERGRIVEARLAAGSVAPTAVRLRAAEAGLRGAAPSGSVAAAAGGLAVEGISPISDVRADATYRRQVVAELVARAVVGVSDR